MCVCVRTRPRARVCVRVRQLWAQAHTSSVSFIQAAGTVNPAHGTMVVCPCVPCCVDTHLCEVESEPESVLCDLRLCPVLPC